MPSNHLLRVRQPELPRVGQIAEQIVPLQILHVNGVHQIIDDAAEEIALRRERPLGLRALHGVTDRAHEQRAVHPALHQVILRPLLHGRERQRFIHEAAQHDHRHLARMGDQPLKGLYPVTVRERKIGDDDIELFAGEPLQGLLQVAGVEKPDRFGVCLDHLAQKQNVIGVVFHH